MNSAERIRIGELWTGLASMYGKEINKLAMNVMLKAVDDLEPILIEKALNEWACRSKLGRHPFPGEVREIVCPEESITAAAQAREIAARICGAIPKYGWSNSRAAMDFIGPIGWHVIERSGGWQFLCENMGVNINPTAFQAQIRDQLTANIQYGSETLEAKIFELPPVRIGSVVRLLSEKKSIDEKPKP